MNNLFFTKGVLNYIAVLISTVSLAACTSSEVPLDPIVGDTGQALSDIALSSDVKFYDLELEVFPTDKKIAGIGKTSFLMLKANQYVELKLDSRFNISDVTVAGKSASYKRLGGIITINLGEVKTPGELVDVAVQYSGKPHIANNAPWEGGFVFDKSSDGKPWIATAVQGEGCDLFWPCKDHFSDKADSMRIRLTVPNGLSAVTNGVLQDVKKLQNDKVQFDWLLSVPASDYNIALNIGNYERIQKSYTSINGTQVPIEFWVLPENKKKAEDLIDFDLLNQIQFFESHLGPYPWGNEKLGFVETPHLGMEHQTINAYGKKYKRDENGYDWLLQHELAHEWFGNLMTHERLNDAWLHEGFGFYMQPAYSLNKFGNAAYSYTMYKSYLGLKNCQPVVREGEVTSDEAFNSDIYGKGGWTLHTLRWLIGEQLFWRATRELLYGIDNTSDIKYPIKPRYRNTEQFIDIVNKLTGDNYNWLFDIYLKQAELPILNKRQVDGVITLNWDVKSLNNKPFPMPLPISINGKEDVYYPQDGKIILNINPDDHVVVDPDMKVLRYLPIISKCNKKQD
ncbi:M1 family metallopeptidase [Pseudoalteromonas rhizosphaerae]|uniref:M1 family metallopeptidase n=1 Tax=Pseudoalteromonas rhizosphaerae TaxID=2518973 RepID=UPI00384BA1A7